MAGLVPAIHVFSARRLPRRGSPGQVFILETYLTLVRRDA
jgi:hypothetical protein